MASARDWKRRRKRQLRKRIIRAAVLVVMAVILIGAVFGIVNVCRNLFGKGEAEPKKKTLKQTADVPKPKAPEKKLVSNKPKMYTRPEAIEVIREAAKDFPEMSAVLEREAEYPDEMLIMLANNPETLEFVKNYPEKKDAGKTADTIGEVKVGEIPFLLQWDSRWGYAAYGSSNIAVSGCGPTALAMVAAGLKTDAAITPYTVAKYAQEQGYYTDAGTSWELMSAGCRVYGIQGEEMSLDAKKIEEHLTGGHPIICSVREGDFTTEGHYIVLVGVENGKIRIHDPNSITRSEKLWSFEELKGQIKNLWWYTIA